MVVAFSTLLGPEFNIADALKRCSSGTKLIAMGFEEDTLPTAEMDADECATSLKCGLNITAG